MDPRRSCTIIVTAGLVALALAGCSRRSHMTENTVTAPPPPAAVAPPVREPRAPQDGNIAAGPMATHDSANDGAFSPDYAPPPASAPANGVAAPQR